MHINSGVSTMSDIGYTMISSCSLLSLLRSTYGRKGKGGQNESIPLPEEKEEEE